MGRASSRRFAWRLSNVHTWASAAHNDADTCLDSLASRHLHRGGDGAHDDVKRRVVALKQVTIKRPLPHQPSPTAAAPAPPRRGPNLELSMNLEGEMRCKPEPAI